MIRSGAIGYDEQDLETNETIIDLRFRITSNKSFRIFEKDETVIRYVIHAITGKEQKSGVLVSS